MNDTYRNLINQAPAHVEKIATLWDWSANCEYPTPATLFLDLIGYTLEEHGELLCGDMAKVINRLGYLELSMLGSAMDEYATRPLDAIEFIEALLDAEDEQ